MKTIEYRWIDKSRWWHGPWDCEPDKVQWSDLETGLPCLAVRHPNLGNWCGYVGVSQEHPWFKKDCDNDEVDIRCHGGLTFADFCQETDKEHGICHLVEPGEPDRVWWFGFDCCHAGDFSPGLDTSIREMGHKSWQGDIYRDLGYVQRECTEIARQLSAKLRKAA